MHAVAQRGMWWLSACCRPFQKHISSLQDRERRAAVQCASEAGLPPLTGVGAEAAHDVQPVVQDGSAIAGAGLGHGRQASVLAQQRIKLPQVGCRGLGMVCVCVRERIGGWMDGGGVCVCLGRGGGDGRAES